VFDLSITKLLVLAVIALIVFGPNELPRIAQQAGKALRDLRQIAEGAKADLMEGLGPEYQDFDFQDLNPKRFVTKHLLEDVNEVTKPLGDELKAFATVNGTTDGGATPSRVTAAVNGSRSVLDDGAEPPFDIEAT
jgi:sec-independent protein translocase protein TatB